MLPLFFWFIGSMTFIPRSEHFDDIYFAVEDGLAESRYVFLEQNNLPHSWHHKDQFVIAETGFGTGLNFLCAWDLFEKTTSPRQHLHYYSFEKFPLSREDIKKYLSHWSDQFGGRLEKLIEDYPLRIGGWHTIRLTPQVTLTIIFDDVNRALPELDTGIDCWFLDGHAPAKNPDMWSETVFQHIGRLSRSGTRFATFTAAGFVRRGLESVGFTVKKARGFGRKRDMSIGIFEQKTPERTLLSIPKKIAIIGGGIAGTCLSYSLSQRGCDVTIFEKNDIASGGSGNIRGLCNPKFTAQRGIESDFYAPAFALAHRLFRDLSRHNDIGFTPCGCLHLFTDEQKERRLRGFQENWGWHGDHAIVLEKDEASRIAGIELSHAALYLPDAAMVSPQKVTSILGQTAKIHRMDVKTICRQDKGWDIEGENYDVVILACGWDVVTFGQTAALPLQKVRGQITRIKMSQEYQNLKTNLCYGGYASHPFDGEAVIGSTFQHWIDDDTLRPEDDRDNIKKLQSVAPQIAEGLEIIGARASFRCASKDRMPIIGEVTGHDDLYLSTAHGSHGILSSIMGAEILSARICGEPQKLPSLAEKFLSAERFKA